MDIIDISQRVASFPFVDPTYEEVIDLCGELLKYLKTHAQQTDSNTFKPVRSIFWELTMRIASVNQFTKSN